jgi:hypothetical protein
LPPFFYSAPACAYLTTADAPNVLLVFPASVAEADHHMVHRRQSNPSARQRD